MDAYQPTFQNSLNKLIIFTIPSLVSAPQKICNEISNIVYENLIGMGIIILFKAIRR